MADARKLADLQAVLEVSRQLGAGCELVGLLQTIERAETIRASESPRKHGN